MAIQFSVGVRNARLNAIETTIGTAPEFVIRVGSQPADCATAATGGLLVQYNLPSDWLNAAASGQITKNGTWSGSAVGTGTAGYFRINRAGSPTECDMQGAISTDMTIDNSSIASGQTVTVSTFTLTDGNA